MWTRLRWRLRAARIERCVWDKVASGDEFRGFEIIASARRDASFTLISPDLAICPDCLAEIRDANERRYRYPFFNCTNCGPSIYDYADHAL